MALMLAAMLMMQSMLATDRPVTPVVPRCTASKPDEIVVCGSRDDRRYRLDPLPEPASPLPKAERTVGGVKVGLVAEQGEVGGVSTNRAMVRLKIKF